LEELHEGICSMYVGGHTLAVMAIGTGYYWPSLREDEMLLLAKPYSC